MWSRAKHAGKGAFGISPLNFCAHEVRNTVHLGGRGGHLYPLSIGLRVCVCFCLGEGSTVRIWPGFCGPRDPRSHSRPPHSLLEGGRRG